ncbi:MAG: DUF2442 domain-containing protein [Myxococcaceae bacterium]
MRSETDSEENRTLGLTTSAAPWRIKNIRLSENYHITVQFKDGLEGVLDLSELIMGKNAGVFSVLRNPILFYQAYLSHGAITWPGELDLAPDAMYESIKNQRKYPDSI